MFQRAFAIVLISVSIGLASVESASASLCGRLGGNMNSSSVKIAGYGGSAANWIPDHPVLDPDVGPCIDPNTGLPSRGRLVNSIYARTANGNAYELGWYKAYENPDDAQAFAVRVALGVYKQWSLGRLNDNCTNYFSLNHVPGTYNYNGYINGSLLHAFTLGGISSSYAQVGSERFCEGDQNEAAFEQLKYRPTDSSWASWDRVTEIAVEKSDPDYLFHGDSSLKKAQVY